MAMKDQMELTITICVGSSIVRFPFFVQEVVLVQYAILNIVANRGIRRPSARYRRMAVSIW